jgi:hypothetical protein
MRDPLSTRRLYSFLGLNQAILPMTHLMKGQHNQIVRMPAINGSIATLTYANSAKENWLVWANLSACWHAGTWSHQGLLQSQGPALTTTLAHDVQLVHTACSHPQDDPGTPVKARRLPALHHSTHPSRYDLQLTFNPCCIADSHVPHVPLTSWTRHEKAGAWHSSAIQPAAAAC